MLAAVLNAVGWVWFVRSFVPLDVEMPELRQAHATGEAPPVHCPRFSLMNRGVAGGYAPIQFELLASTNAVPLFLAARETLPYGIRVVDPLLFAVFATLQWIGLGIACCYLWYWVVKR